MASRLLKLVCLPPPTHLANERNFINLLFHTWLLLITRRLITTTFVHLVNWQPFPAFIHTSAARLRYDVAPNLGAYRCLSHTASHVQINTKLFHVNFSHNFTHFHPKSMQRSARNVHYSSHRHQHYLLPQARLTLAKSEVNISRAHSVVCAGSVCASFLKPFCSSTSLKI